jgi:hypothetical protein
MFFKIPYNVCLTLPVKPKNLQYEKAEPPFLAPAGIRFNRTLKGCMKDNITKTYQIMTRCVCRQGRGVCKHKVRACSNNDKAGKIFIRGNYLFINELDKAFHIYDNANPTIKSSCIHQNSRQHRSCCKWSLSIRRHVYRYGNHRYRRSITR